MYKNIGIIIKSHLDCKNDAVAKVLQVLESLGCLVHFEEHELAELPCASHCKIFTVHSILDALVTIGGDGTIIKAVRLYKDMQCPIITVHQGTVGFLAEIDLDEVGTVLPELLQGNGNTEERSLVHATVMDGDTEVFSEDALNEIVIAQGSIARLFDLDVEIDGDMLASYQADGLLIATPTGSTAYNLSAGGPIVHPALQASIVTPINPYSLTQKPVVIPAHKELVVKPHVSDKQQVYVTVDGQASFLLTKGNTLHVRKSLQHITFLRRKEDTFFHTLRTKLKWAESVNKTADS